MLEYSEKLTSKANWKALAIRRLKLLLLTPAVLLAAPAPTATDADLLAATPVATFGGTHTE